MAGKCLTSYANSPKNAYTFYGAEVEANAYITISNGSTAPILHASKKLKGGTEILWNYRGMRLPKTIEEESFSKISAKAFPNEWVYSFSRTQVIEMFMCFNANHPRYNEGLEILNDAIANIDDCNDQLCQMGINIRNSHFAQHRLVPPEVNASDKTTKKVTFI
jgi:hypothetical protein